MSGLLLPRDRNKTLTGLAGAEPITGAQHGEVQWLQWFLWESTWDHEQVNERRVGLLSVACRLLCVVVRWGSIGVSGNRAWNRAWRACAVCAPPAVEPRTPRTPL